MYLKTLTLRGFKSFATSTTLRFEPGINCVVGPNGSGKSNVVDALTWVMGEQGAKNLRGGNMADVIFAGTASRPALGRAEVSLTIDNTDGALPIDFSEVTISRTLFRSGGSEYAINGTACRLLDIQELLSDTGMGKEMHVIIGQGKLDEVLTATPDERRSFIEEAAGVLKHRRRKEKALRKLDSMQGNLTRIEDLAGELRRQLGPLARQAATARRAQVIQRDVFDARARLLADDLAQAQARLQAQSIDDAKLAEQRAAIREKVRELRESVENLQQEADRHSPYLAQLAERYQRLSSLIERFRSLADLAAERERSLCAQAPSAHRGEAPESIRERAQRAQEEENDLAAQAAQAEQVLEQKIMDREAADKTETEIDTRLAGVNRTLADRRENTARLAGQITAARSRLEALTSERERVDAARTDANERAASAAKEVAALEQDAVAHTTGDDTLSIAHEEAARELQAAKEVLETARAQLARAQADAVQWQTKADTLALSLVPEDATAWVIEEHRSGVSGLVRDALRITSGWEAGIEAALAGSAEGAVVTDIECAVDTLRAAREAGAGHVELIIGSPSDSGKDVPSNDEREARAGAALKACGFSESEAVVASSVVTGTSAAVDAVRELVAGTVLVVDLVTAKTLLEAGAPRVATLAGDVLTAHRAWGGQMQAGAVLSRQAMYDDAVAQAQEAVLNQEKARKKLEQAEQSLAEADGEYKHLSAELNARDSQLAAVTAQLGVLRQSLDSARAEVERDERRLADIDAEIAARRKDVETLGAQQLELAAEPEDLAHTAHDLAQERERAHAATIAARTAETEARLALRTTEERLRAVQGKAEQLERTARQVEERIQQEERAAVRRAQAAAAAHGVMQKAQRALNIARMWADSIASERREAEAAGAQRSAALSAARRHLDDARSDERELEDAGHQRELALAEQKLKYEQLEARALEIAGVPAQTLVDEFGPHLPVPMFTPEQLAQETAHAADEDSSAGDDGSARVRSVPDSAGVQGVKTVPFVRAEQEKRLAKAERDLAKLGKINPLALEEHAALEERQRYLMEQLQDLRRSREDLLKMIRDIDGKVEDVMASAMADVASKFTEVFAVLFPGGEGHLMLTDPEHMLTTGVDIEARPPGKRVKRLSLLSGGERSLTAIAFLIAIFMARPSPFYVMDEVEAALDDVNLSRLLELFEQLRENSQLLVITHQKRTMEKADALYGVAMRERGVTSVLSQRMADIVDI